LEIFFRLFVPFCGDESPRTRARAEKGLKNTPIRANSRQKATSAIAKHEFGKEKVKKR